MKKRILGIFTALALCLSLLPAAALAVTVTGVPYYDWNSATKQLEPKSCSSATAVTSGDTGWSNGWYVAQGTVEIGSRVTVSGSVNLILTDGCAITVTGGIGVNSGNSLTIYGQSASSGRLTATGTDGTGHNAGIGGTDSNAAGSITINGGVINATGSTGRSYGGAGIGGGWQCDGGTITINGGNVTATGGTGSSYGGAGIGGGGYGGSGGTINISGSADVTAKGGGAISKSGHSGAGIGGGGTAVNGGGSGSGGTINISGGKVVATGGAIILSGTETGNNNSGSGAGIGGGSSSSDSGKDRGSGGTINISGGSVTATGGSGNFSGAGIGSGGTSGSNGNDGGNITISGGTVTATGGESKDVNSSGACGAGIGGGGKGGGGTVTISGGSVTATSGTANSANTASTYGGEGIGSGGCYKKDNGSFATTTSGNAIIKASSIGDQSGKAANAVNPWSGFIFEGNSGTVYGDQTLSEDFTLTVESTENLLVCEGASLDANGNLTNNGTVYVDGSLTNSGTVGGTGTVYYRLGLTDCTATPTSYAEAGDKVTLAANTAPTEQVFANWTVKDASNNDLTVANGIFTMPSSAVTVKANFVDALKCTITDTPSIEYGDTATLTALVQKYQYDTSSNTGEYISLTETAAYQWYQKAGETGTALDNETDTLSLSGLTVGTYTYYCAVSCDGYSATSNDAMIEVGKAAGSVSIAGTPGKTYDGTVVSMEGKYNVTGDGTVTVEYKDKDAADTTYSTIAPKDAGSYTVRVTMEGGTNYTEAFATKDFTISPQTVTVSGITAEDKTYDGSTKATLDYSGATLTGKVDGDDLSVTATGTFVDKDAADGKRVNITGLTLTGTSTGNYILATNGQQTETTANITPKPVTVTIAAKSSVYGKAIAELTGSTPEGAVYACDLVNGKEPYTLSTTATSSSPVGSYDINGTSNSSNYTFTFTGGTGAYTITQASLSASVTLDGWTYGTPNEPVVTGNTENGEVTYRYKVKGASGYLEAKPTDVGEYTVEATIAATANYEEAVVYDDFTIAKKELTITGLTAIDRDYDGTKNVTLTGGTLVGIVGDDDVSAAMPTSGTIQTADAGTGKTVSFAEITLTGAKVGNYTLTQPTVTVNIRKVSATLDSAPAAIENLVYSGSAQELVTPAGTAHGGEVKYSLNHIDWINTIPTGRDAGEYTVWYKVAGDSNHNDTETQQVIVTIAQAEVSEPTVSGTYTYDGQDQIVSLTGYNSSYMSISGNTKKNAGEYTAEVTLDSNHKWAEGSDGLVEWRIAPKGIIVSGITAKDKIYDGTTAAELDYTGVTLAGKVGSDDLSAAAAGAFDSAAAGEDKTVTISGLTLGGAAKENYVLATDGQQTGTTASITAAAQTPTITPTASLTRGGNTLDLRTLVAGNQGDAVTFSVVSGDAATLGTDSYTLTSDTTEIGAVILTVQITDKDVEGDSNPEYSAYTGASAITVTVTDKTTAALTGGVTQTDCTYGEMLADPSYTEPAGTIGTTITYSGTLRKDSSPYSNTAKPTEAGTYTVTVQCETMTHIYTAISDPFTIAPKSIEDASVTLGESLTYTGSRQTQTVTEVKLSGADITSSCDVSNNVQTNAGNYTLTVTAKDASNYTGSVTQDFTIARKSITPTIEVTGTYSYTGSAISPTFTVKDGDTALTDNDYTADFSNNINAGSGMITVTEKATGNYTFAEAQQSFTIGKVDYDGTATANGSAKYGNPGTVDLSNYLADGYVIGAITKTNGDMFAGNPSMDGTSLKFSFANVSGNVGQTAEITVPVTGATNYNAYSIKVTVTVEAKAVPDVSAPTAVAGLTYNGETQTLISTGSTTGGEMQYSLTSGTGYSTELPAAVNAGSYTVYYKVVGNSDFADVGENSLTVTIDKKEVTAAPKDVTVTRGSAIPAFELTYTGLLGDDTLTPNSDPTFTCFEADGTTAVSTGTAAGTYTITWTNAGIAFTGGENYRVVAETGTLTINNPSSGGSSNTTTKTEKNPDGSTTTTVTDKTTGTVTETTKNTDGSTTVVETKKDGTVTETNKTADGTAGTVVTDKNGEVTEVTSAVSSAAAEEAARTGGAVKLPVEVPAAKSTEDAPAVEITVPKSAGEVKVEIPVEKVTPGTVAVIVKADGTEEIVSTSIPTETGVVLALDGSATVKVINNAKEFSDIPAASWASDAVAFASARGITGGTSDTTFSPDASCTRAQIVTFLWRAAGSPEPENLSSLSDVPADAYYAKAVAWALENGITGGTGNGMFSPDATCTRSQSVTFLYRAAGSPTASDDIAFSDVAADSYYADAVAWAAQNGITSGIGNGLFGPANECSRAQNVTFLYHWMVK